MKYLSNIFASTILLLALAAGLVGCEQFVDMDVEDQTEPDREAALEAPVDIQSLIRGSMQEHFNAHQGTVPSVPLGTKANTVSSSWGNFGMQHVSSVPRPELRNTTGFTYASLFEDPWYDNYRAISNANDGLRAIEDRFDGTLEIDGADRTARARAFAKFTKGKAYGWLGLLYDRAPLAGAEDDPEAIDDPRDVAPFEEWAEYPEVIDFAIERLDEAIEIAQNNTFNYGDGWIEGYQLDDQRLIDFAQVQKARLMAYQARTPDERAQADWNQIYDLIEQHGFDEPVEVDGTDWATGMQLYGYLQLWNRVDYLFVGPADQGDAFQNWLDQPWAQRTSTSDSPVTIETEDRRVVGEEGADYADRAAQVGGVGAEDAQVPGKYIAHVGEGSAGFQAGRGTYHFSDYLFVRDLEYWWESPQGQGFVPWVRPAELDLLQAEALLRTGGDLGEVRDLIDNTRVGVGELDPVSEDAPVGDPLDKPSINEEDGLWALMKYEKRMETFHTTGGLAYFDRRGLGTLVPGTALHFPAPARELETFDQAPYSFGGDPDAETSAPEAWEWTVDDFSF